MQYLMEIEYIRRVPWWRRLRFIVLQLRLWEYWHPGTVWFASWLTRLGFNRWLTLVCDPLEYANTDIELEIEYTGHWNPPEPEVGILSAWYEVDNWSYDKILVLPGDYEEELQDVSLQQLMNAERDRITRAIEIHAEGGFV